VTASKLSSKSLGGLLARIADNTFRQAGKEVFEVMWAEDADADTVIEARGLKQITDSAHRETDRGDHGREPERSWPITVRARTSCSASSRPGHEVSGGKPSRAAQRAAKKKLAP